MREKQLKQWICESRVRGLDLVRREGTKAWVPLMETELRALVLQTMHDERPLASMCPLCGAAMIAMARNRTTWRIVG